MPSHLSIAGLPAEDRNLHLSFDAGKILLNEQRMVLMHTHAMGALRIKLEYERECYRQAKLRVRRQLKALQAAVSEEVAALPQSAREHRGERPLE